MAETVIDQIVAGLREIAPSAYPARSGFRDVRLVGHTPKADHFVYDMVLEFADASERIAAKVYRPTRASQGSAQKLAQAEFKNLRHAYESVHKKGIDGVPRPIGDFTEYGAVVAEKINGLPLQSMIMKAALLPGFADRGLLARSA